MKVKLIDNWKDWWKMWSVRINILIGLVIAGISQFPDVFLHLWMMVPDTIKDRIVDIENSAFWFLAAIVLSTVARLVKQDRLHKEDDTTKKDDEDVGSN